MKPVESPDAPAPSGGVFSVTEVRNALRCPRVFSLGRILRHAVAFPLGSSCLGAAFHRIVDRFAGTVATPPAHFASLGGLKDRRVVEDALNRWLLGILADELAANAGYWAMPGEVDDLAEALRQFSAHLAERLGRFEGTPAGAIGALVRSGERPVEAGFEEAGVVVRGRIDALYGTETGELQVVEYKLTDEANDSLDRAQVTLYRELLRRAEGTHARPVLLRFNPGLAVSGIQEREADRLTREVLLPLLRDMAVWASAPAKTPAPRRGDLCAACPVAGECVQHYPDHFAYRDDPPAPGRRPRPTVSGALSTAQDRIIPVRPQADAQGCEEAGRFKDRILAELRRDGVSAEAREVVVGPTLYVVSVIQARGPVRHMDLAAENVKHRLATADEVDVDYCKDGGRRQFRIQRKQPIPVLLGPLLLERKEWLSQRPGRCVIGRQPDGTILLADLADPATPHLLVGGQAGSGKSELLKTLVASLAHFHDPARLRITLIDPKRVTFNANRFQAGIASHLDGPVLFDLEEAMPCFERYIQIMEDRYLRFQQAGVSDLHEYNDSAKPGEVLPRHVVVMDEFQDLTADRAQSREFCALVKRLGAKARAAGVHLILATQRPDRETVPPNLKTNLGGKIALRVVSSVNSRVILDQSGAEKLFGRGDLLADLGKGLVRAQAALVTKQSP